MVTNNVPNPKNKRQQRHSALSEVKIKLKLNRNSKVRRIREKERDQCYSFRKLYNQFGIELMSTHFQFLT